MMMTTEEFKKEASSYYKLGYKCGYLTLVKFLKENMSSKEFDIYRYKIKEHYDNYPCMELLNLDEINKC